MSDVTPLAEAELVELYTDLHRHPELPFQETRTAGIAAQRITALGYTVHTGIGGTGVVGVLDNGDGPTALLRADMDGLPVLEATGLPYASTARGLGPDGVDVPVMHACGHDVHVTCLVGAAAQLAAERDTWSGRLVVLFQPAEEIGGGAQAMLDDGLYATVPRPDVVLGQHVGPFPVGMIAIHPGLAYANSDSLTVTMRGRGGHGSRPEATIDPVVMAAATVMRLQGVIARETAASEAAVVTVGMLQAGTLHNIIPDEARLGLNVRSFDPVVRRRTLDAIERIVRAEAAASGAPEPRIDVASRFPGMVNDPAATARAVALFGEWLGADKVIDQGAITGSEDVGVLSDAAGVPLVYWTLGGGDPAPFAGATTVAEALEVLRSVPSNHSPAFAPLPSPTLVLGVEALVRATRAWLPPHA